MNEKKELDDYLTMRNFSDILKVNDYDRMLFEMEHAFPEAYAKMKSHFEYRRKRDSVGALLA